MTLGDDASPGQPVSPTSPTRRQPTAIKPTTTREQLGERLFNAAVCFAPSNWLRITWLRGFGATIGRNCAIKAGTRVHGLSHLEIGDDCSVGARCLLDARGGVAIGSDTVLADEVQLITAQHVIDSDDFAACVAPIRIGHHALLGARSTVVMGVDVGAGAVIETCSLVREDAPELAVLRGVPAKVRGMRSSALSYHPNSRSAG